jgi:hypothetical protein
MKDFITKYHKEAIDVMKDRFNEDLSNYNIVFDNVKEDGCSLATCDNENKTITYYMDNWDIDRLNEHELIKQILEAIIHEQAHAICYKYGLCMEFNPKCIDHHNISFALVVGCLEREILKKSTDLYNPYNLSQELGILERKIQVNPKAFENRIKSIKFNTIEQLSKQAFSYAENVREKYKLLTHKQFNRKPKGA